MLTDTKDKVIDSVLFGEQTRGISKGRYPDGASVIVFFPNSATPGRANLILGDSDDDGLPNLWEDQYGLNPNDASDAAHTTPITTATPTSRNSSPAQGQTTPPAFCR